MALVHVLVGLLFLLHNSAIPTNGDDLYHLCKNSTYTANSTYQSNLNLLLTSLTSFSSKSTFYNDTVGTAPDSVYGLFLCRGDIILSDCKTCLQNASQNITQKCAYYRKATIWYDNCELRYSDTDFFSTSDGTYIFISNTADQDYAGTFANMEEQLMDNLTERAYDSSLMFATGSLWYTSDLPSIYGLVQCTRDLSPDVCRDCLQQAYELYQKDSQARQGGHVLSQACNFRYEVYKFYQGQPTVALNVSASAATNVSAATKEGKKNTGKVLGIVISLAAALALILALFICFRRRSQKDTLGIALLGEITSEESLLIDLSILKASTNNFSDANTLGRGGFGTVYKGTLPDGQEIAVKRLSATSRQGIGELKNELLLVAKLQHKNLVRLLGVCLEEEERLLVYEYVPNRSLDTFLFDPTRCKELSWEKRFEIIRGIARGLRYLHEESHLRVIHRDMKASNVLLDADLNPKIADFGLARLFGINETQCTTSHVIGTFGYMAPEYAMRGRLSVKMDVFSFGVLVLEILTGRKNSSFGEDEHAHDLLSYTWEHWIAETFCEIVDPSLGEEYSRDEVLRCIRVGLQCVQDVPANRPLMSSVVLMLHSPSTTIQDPLQPVFGAGSSTSESSVSTQQSGSNYTHKSRVSL